MPCSRFSLQREQITSLVGHSLNTRWIIAPRPVCSTCKVFQDNCSKDKEVLYFAHIWQLFNISLIKVKFVYYLNHFNNKTKKLFVIRILKDHWTIRKNYLHKKVPKKYFLKINKPSYIGHNLSAYLLVEAASMHYLPNHHLALSGQMDQTFHQY